MDEWTYRTDHRDSMCSMRTGLARSFSLLASPLIRPSYSLRWWWW
jgi:hypothetical protein